MRTPTLLCHEVREGKTEAAKQFMQECLDAKKEEYNDLLKRYDLNDTRMWFHDFNGKTYFLFTHDVGPEGFQRLEGWAESTHSFDHWFDKQLHEHFVMDNFSVPELFGFISVK
jgi:hypothetical protein